MLFTACVLKLDSLKKCISRPVSLKPHQILFSAKRAFNADLSFSGYIQRLVEYDKSHNILPAALAAKLSASVP